MEPYITIYLRYYGLFLFSALLLYAAGKLILLSLSGVFKAEGFYQGIFLSLALGIFSLVTIFSLGIAHFVTISSGFLLIAFFLVYELVRFRSEKQKIFTLVSFERAYDRKKIVAAIPVLFLLSLLLFSWQAFTILKGGAFPFIVPERDHIFYADLAEILLQTGQENNYQAGNLVSDKFSGTVPYHYFEMWLAAFFSWLFGIKALLSMQLITLPVFFTMMALGIFSVAETVYAISLKKMALIFLLAFMGGIPFVIDRSSDYFQWITSIESPLFFEKAAPHYWIALVGFLFILNNFFTAGFIVFVSMLFVSGTTFPAIAGGGAAFLIFSSIFRMQEKTDLKKQVIYFSGAIIFFALFYAVSGNPDYSFRTAYPLLYYTDLSPMLERGFELFTLKVALAELIVRMYRVPLELVLVLVPFLLIISLAGKKKLNVLSVLRLPAVFILCIYISSLACSGIFYKMNDSGQFHENIYFFILSLLAVAFILLPARSLSPAVKNVLFVSLVLLLVFKFFTYAYNRVLTRSIFKNVYSDEYLIEISKTGYKGNPLGIFFRPQPGSARVTGRNAQMLSRIGGYTGFFPPFSSAVDLGLTEMTNWDAGRWGELEQAIVKTSPFYLYAEEQKKKGSFVSAGQCQARFIEDFNIGYAIAARGYVMSPLIIKKVSKTIVDARSGERFMLLQ